MILSITVSSFNAVAQELGYGAKQVTQQKVQRENRFSIGLVAGPQFTCATNIGSAQSSGKTGFLAGAFLEFNIIKSFNLNIGINYDRRSFGLNFFAPFIQFNDSVISYNSYSVIDMKYDIDYLTLPLNILYTVGEGKLKFFLKGTFYYSVYLSAYKKGYTNIYIHPDDYQYIDPELDPDIKPGDNRIDYHGKTEDLLGDLKFSNFDIGMVFSLGLTYDMTDQIALRLSPGFQSSFGRLLDNPSYKSIKWNRNISLETGVVYRLK